MKYFTIVLFSLVTIHAYGADTTQELDSLGANKDLMRKSQALDPDNKIRVVQHREVDRNNRLELGINYGMVATGGDSYVNTTGLGGQIDYHFNPRWSMGARYTTYANSLSPEGQQVFNNEAQHINNGDPNNGWRPGVDYANYSWLAVGNWYPIYGKLNFFDTSVTQFDLYLVGGAGMINLASGNAPLYTAGGGIGIWFTQHFASRLEARWQGYQDQVWDGTQNITRNQNEMVMMATISFML